MGVILHRRPRDSHPIALLLGHIRDTLTGLRRDVETLNTRLAAMDRRLDRLTEEHTMANRDRTHDDGSVEQEQQGDPQPAKPEGPTPTQPADNPNRQG